MSPLSVEVREHGQRIASYPGGEICTAQAQWLQDTGAQLVAADTLNIHCGLLTMLVKQGDVSRRIEIVVMVNSDGM